MTPYIINVGLVVTGCLVFYKIFLQRITFYRLNRSILIFCMVASFVLPLIPVPQEWSFRQAKEEPTSKTTLASVREIVRSVPSQHIQTEKITIRPEATSPLSHQATISNSESTISLPQIISAFAWLYWF